MTSSSIPDRISRGVVDDEKTSRELVALAHEEIEIYDASYYETKLVQAVGRTFPLTGIRTTSGKLNGIRVVADWV